MTQADLIIQIHLELVLFILFLYFATIVNNG